MTSSTGRDGWADVLVIGGGNAGISAAARFLRKGVSSVAVVEPQTVHTYRPLLSYVGGGQAALRTAQRTQRSVTPKGCSWIQDSAVAVDPHARVATLASGRTHGYRDLVLGAGLVPDDEALPGIADALRSPAVASNYLDHAEKTWDLVRGMRSGHAVFTVPRPPVSCTGTTIKPLFLAAAHWKRAGCLGDIDITLIVDRTGLVDVPDLDDRLNRCLDELKVRVLHRTSVTKVDPGRTELTVMGPDGEPHSVPYDLLHLVPPFRGPAWLADSDLTDVDRHGVVDVDPCTFRHRVHPDVWAVGDGAGVDTDPSGGALRRQVKILVDNVLAARSGGKLDEYDGYTVAPVATDAHLLIAGEFDRSGAVTSSLPSFVDPLKPRRTAWAFDRYGLPQTYWNLILEGRV